MNRKRFVPHAHHRPDDPCNTTLSIKAYFMGVVLSVITAIILAIFSIVGIIIAIFRGPDVFKNHLISFVEGINKGQKGP